jgi:ABC-type sugar transport system ATPase subunit
VAATIQADAISKRFGTTQAVDQVNLSVETGRVLALLGQTGSVRRPRSGCSPR